MVVSNNKTINSSYTRLTLQPPPPPTTLFLSVLQLGQPILDRVVQEKKKVGIHLGHVTEMNCLNDCDGPAVSCARQELIYDHSLCKVQLASADAFR